MQPASYINVNGMLLDVAKPALPINNSSYKYGEGLFETIKVTDGNIQLATLHFERLFNGLKLLATTVPSFFTSKKISQQIIELCQKNNCLSAARVRLTVGNDLYKENEKQLFYTIEANPLPQAIPIEKRTISLGLFAAAKKSMDVFSNLKSASYLIYRMAAQFACDNNDDDCIVCNTDGYIADTSIANIFLIKEGVFFTPSLSQGCVAGVMRRNIINQLKQNNVSIIETTLTIQEVENADEIFLTNAIKGLTAVSRFGNKSYGYKQLLTFTDSLDF